jgi:hypothetical protein
MLPIDNELIKRVENGDLIVRGSPDEILKFKYEDGWFVLGNHRESEELELERSRFARKPFFQIEGEK